MNFKLEINIRNILILLKLKLYNFIIINLY